MSVGILINANSRKNRGRAGRAEEVRAAVGPHAIVRETKDLSELRPVVEEFIEAGCRYWVSDGGDGTFHWLMNAGREVLSDRGDGAVVQVFPYRLVPTNGGTIDFIARKAGIHGQSDAVIRKLVEGVRLGHEFAAEPIDTLLITGHRVGDPAGVDAFCRVGFAVAVGGIGQRFFAKYYEARNPGPWTIIEVSVKAGLGQAAMLPGLRSLPFLDGLRRFADDVLGGTRARVAIDGRQLPHNLFQGLHAGAVDIDFGTMKLFPYAATPGRMHVVAGAMDRIECAWKWVFLVAGRPVPGGNWIETPGELFEVEALPGETLDPVIDGEIFRGLDRVVVRLGPKVLVPRIPGRAFRYRP